MAQSPINAGKIPVPDLDAVALSVDASFLHTDAGSVRGTGADVKSSWAGLSGVYSAPEDAQLFAVMDPVATVTDSFASDVATVAKALQDFATEAGPLAATLSSTKTSAAAFAARVKDDDDWDHDQDLVDENNGYVHTVNTTIVAFQAAERKAANTIEKLIGGHTWHTADPHAAHQDKYAYGYDSIPDNAKTPWGAKVEKQDGCLMSTVKGAGHFFVGIGTAAWEMVKGVGLLVWDASGFGGWDKFKQAWEGIGFLGTMLLGPAGFATGMAIWGPKGYTDRIKAMGKGLLAWNDWKTDPAKAAGEVVFNIGTLFIPVGGEIAAGADGLRGAELAADAARGAKAASKAGKLANAAKTGVKVFAKYTDPFTYATKLPKVLDIANSLKTKFGDLSGFTKTGTSDLDKTMSAWTHEATHPGEPAHAGTGEHAGSAGDHGGGGTTTHTGAGDHGGPSGHTGTGDHGAGGDHGNGTTDGGASAHDGNSHDGASGHDGGAGDRDGLHSYDDVPQPPQGTHHSLNDPAVEKWIDHVVKEHPELTHDGVRGLYDYTTDSGYQAMNAELRHPSTGPAADAINARIADAEKGLSELPTYDGTTFRGTNLPQSVVDNLHVGGPFDDPAFQSTSLNEGVTKGFINMHEDNPTLFTIHGDSGVNIQPFSAAQREAEILFAPGTDFRVITNYVDDTGLRHVTLQEVG